MVLRAAVWCSVFRLKLLLFHALPLVGGTGFEPACLTAADFKSAASTDFAIPRIVVPIVGFELTTYALQVRCSTN